MNKNVSDKPRQTPRAANKTDNQKFISDDDIVGQTDWLKQGLHRQMKSGKGKSGEPSFVSDEDIVQRRVA